MSTNGTPTRKARPESRFTALMDALKEPEPTTTTAVSEMPVAEPESLTNGEKKPGRPRGKRSDPEYVQVTAYIRRSTHRRAALALLRQEPRREFSDLVEALVAQWLAEQEAT